LGTNVAVIKKVSDGCIQLIEVTSGLHL
jgi:hypothetical protein